MAKKHIDRASLIAAIRELKELSNEQKSDILQLISEQKKYGLVWEDSPEEVEEKMRATIPVLTEDKDKFIDSDAVDAPNHILIEGDNLEALTALTYTHEGKIDVIYIDPPYNTGNKDFVYNDSFVDSEDGYRHSKWLSFMEKRLKIAKKLLSYKGVIFISIDYYSFAQLKLLCDEIFECSSNPNNWNFLECLIWNKQHSQQQGAFKRYHEYVFVYAKDRKNISNVLSKGEGIIEAGAMKKISLKNPASEFVFPAGITFEAPDGTSFSGTYGDSEKVIVKEGLLYAENGKTKYPVTLEAGWTQKKQMQSWVNGQETIDTKGQKVIEFYFNSTGKIKCRKERGVVTPSTLLPEFGMGSEQTSHLEEILGVPGKFTNPKPVEMIKLFINWFCPPDGVVLDFFAGSGTTLHATMQLNEEDGGHRQCILCTNNENGICEEVTYERNKRVINGYTKTNGDFVEGLHGNKLRYYKIEHVEREINVTNRTKLIRMSTDLLCVKENLYDEVGQFGSLKFKKSIARYFADANKQMLIVYEPRAVEYIANELRKDSSLATKHRPLKIYVYSDGAYAYTDEFEGLLDKVELTAMPNALSQALHNVLPEPITNDFEEGEIGND